MKIGWALDMIGWACAQPGPTLATPLLRTPVIENGSVYRSNIFLETIQCTFKQGKDSQGTVIVPDRFYNFKS